MSLISNSAVCTVVTIPGCRFNLDLRDVKKWTEAQETLIIIWTGTKVHGMFEYSLVMNISLTIVCCHGDHVATTTLSPWQHSCIVHCWGQKSGWSHNLVQNLDHLCHYGWQLKRINFSTWIKGRNVLWLHHGYQSIPMLHKPVCFSWSTPSCVTANKFANGLQCYKPTGQFVTIVCSVYIGSASSQWSQYNMLLI